MARPASGAEHIDAAKELLRTAKTAEELRLAQAVRYRSWLPWLALYHGIQKASKILAEPIGALWTIKC